MSQQPGTGRERPKMAAGSVSEVDRTLSEKDLKARLVVVEEKMQKVEAERKGLQAEQRKWFQSKKKAEEIASRIEELRFEWLRLQIDEKNVIERALHVIQQLHPQG